VIGGYRYQAQRQTASGFCGGDTCEVGAWDVMSVVVVRFCAVAQTGRFVSLNLHLLCSSKSPLRPLTTHPKPNPLGGLISQNLPQPRREAGWVLLKNLTQPSGSMGWVIGLGTHPYHV